MKKIFTKHVQLVVFSIVALLLLGFFVLPQVTAKTYTADEASGQIDTSVATADPLDPSGTALLADTSTATAVSTATHLPTPEPLYGIYMTSWVASTPSLRNNLIKLVDETSINAIVIDIKDYSGKIAYLTDDPTINMYGAAESRIKGIEEIIADLHAKGVYVIGRVTVFQDPYLAKKFPDLAIKRVSDGGLWADKNGLHYLYPGNPDVWAYTAAIAKDAYAKGFDEINFDYVRFPSDGNIKDMAIPDSTLSKSEIVEEFFAYLDTELKDTGMKTSADLFGMTTTNTDDLGIGQVLEKALPYFDYVCPMVYPSHYPPNFNGWANPNANPHDLIEYVMSAAVVRAEAMKNDPAQPESVRSRVNKDQLRPWLQNFSLGTPPYTSAEIRAQLDGTYDAGLTSWLLWDAANKYNYTRGALVE
jgi:hypothetical protein